MFQLAFQAQHSAVQLAAALAVVARAEGRGWLEIAEAAGISEASARARWGGAKAAKLVAEVSSAAQQRTPPRTHAALALTDGLLLPVVPAVEQYARLLSSALKTLQRRSDMSPVDLAQRAEIPVPAVHLVLDGRAVAPWPLVYVLTDLLGGDPEDVKWLWERTWHGPRRRHAAVGSQALSAALRGARLAAGAPELSVLSQRAGLAPEETEAAFEGRTEPDWTVFSRLFACLGADPEELRPPQVPQQRRARAPQSGGEGK